MPAGQAEELHAPEQLTRRRRHDYASHGTGRRAARKLRSQGFRSPLALTSWQSHTVTRDDATVQVTSLPGQHAPRPLGYLVPRVMGSLLDFSRGGQRLLRMYVTVAVLPLTAFRPPAPGPSMGAA